ncbi:MAG: APC family permease [Mycoplasmataceae bacterium]|nr:APC family permease [Mycoplasmataceae bacterium]
MKEKQTKQTKQIAQNKGGYGLISLMAMIIGIVIGSGIFVKNQGLLEINGSILNSMLAWIIGAIIVITVLIAFLEIISITEITNEQATLANWGRHLIGIKFGKSIGYYFTLIYFPLIMAGLFSFAGNQFMDTLSASGWIDLKKWSFLQLEAAIIIITTIFIGFITLMNTLSTKPGKYLQNIGTAIKTIPLFFIIILFLFLIVSNISSIDFDKETAGIIGEENKDLNSFWLVIMTIPAILFSFDGFLFAGALSKESKSPTTFRTAFIISIIFIVVIYVSFSIAIFGIGVTDTTHGKYGTITNAIFAGISNQVAASIIAPIVSGIIVLSIITGASGCFIAASRNLSDLSIHNAVVDKEMKYITKNKYGVSTGAGAVITLITLFWFVIAVTFDTYLVSNNISGPLVITGYMTDLIVVGAFTLYGTLIISAIRNRFISKEKRVEVKKNKMFIPAAIISSILSLGVTAYFAFVTITPFAVILGGEWDSSSWTIYWAKLIFFVIFITFTIAVIIINIRNSENMDPLLIEAKKKQALIYYGEVSEKINLEINNIQKTKLNDKNSISNKKKFKEKINKYYNQTILKIFDKKSKK